jgi:3-oxoacyl-[acyl-carrier-protein] synthase III
MVRRERWLLSRNGRRAEIPRISLWLIAVTQIQFAYLAVNEAIADQVISPGG